MPSVNAAPRLGPQFKVKWPNDLLLGSEKLAGILIEGESEPGFAVVVGFGVNCASHPDDTAYPATNLEAAGAVVAPEALLAALAAAMARRLTQWARGRGLCRYPRRLAQARGRPRRGYPRAPAGARTHAADFIGLDEAGHLRLEQPEGLTTVTAGEVFALGRS